MGVSAQTMKSASSELRDILSNRTVQALGGASLLATGATLYDRHQATKHLKGFAELDEKVKDKAKYPLVNSKDYVKSVDPTVTVLSSHREIVDALRKELPDAPSRLIDRTALEAEFILHYGVNAAMLTGRHGDYIIASKECLADILEHELGHIRDYREKGIISVDLTRKDAYAPTNIIQSLARKYLRSSYEKGQYQAEVNAWKHAKDSPTKEEIQKAALDSYIGGFHYDRSNSSKGIAAITAALALVAADSVPSKKLPQVHASRALL